MKVFYSERVQKILSILAFFFIISVLAIIANRPAASGYELSIYTAFPWYFWILLIAAGTCGISVLVTHAFYVEKSNMGIIGLSIVVITITVFLLLPIFRGYAIYGHGDLPFHLGQVRFLLDNGHTAEGNIYPIIHILGANIMLLTDISYGATATLLSLFFSLLFLFFMFIAASVIGTNRKQIFFITTFACPLLLSFFHKEIHPSILSFFMLPLFFYLFHKRETYRSISFTISLVVLFFALIFFHPITFLITVFLFIALSISNSIYYYIKNKKFTSFKFINLHKLFIFITLIILFLGWTISNPRFQRLISKIFEGGNSPFEEVISLLGKSGITIQQFLWLFFNMYGDIIPYFIISAAGIFFIFKKIKSGKYISINQFRYYLLLILGFLITAAFWLSPLIVETFRRSMRWAILFSIITTGFTIHYLIQLRGKQPLITKKIVILLIITLVAFSFTMTVFNVYQSPTISRANPQLSDMRLIGTGWFFQNKDTETTIVNSHASMVRLSQFYGLSIPANLRQVPIPNHFGYTENNSLWETFNKSPRYILTCKLDRIFPQVFPASIRSKTNQYSETDFKKLENDRTVNKIYVNGEFETWKTM